MNPDFQPDIVDDPVRIAPPGELPSDEDFLDPLDEEPIEVIDMNSGKQVAAIALDIPAKPTSGDLLEALCRAYEAGFTAGRSEGFSAGYSGASAHHVAVQDLVMKALQP